MNPTITAITAAMAVLSAGCSSRTALHVTVGSTASTEGSILVEIAAQHLEKQLGRGVDRKLDLTSTSTAYESLTMSMVDVYPEDTDALMASVLKDPLDPNPDIVLERVRGEMQRQANIWVSRPLGINRRMCMVVRSADVRPGNIRTLTEASKSQLAWTLGATSEFQQRADGYSALMSTYNLPLSVPPKPMAAGLLYPALTSNQVSMIAGYDTDGLLAEGSEFLQLKDDRAAFHESRKCFLVRQESIDREPKLRPALDQLAGKFSNVAMRQLNYEVEALRRPVKDVAAAFLKKAGL